MAFNPHGDVNEAVGSSVRQVWKCRDRSLDVHGRALIMGVLNVTPDSFSDGGQYTSAQAAIERAQAMIEQGADIIDVGGESSRPGAVAVTAEEETSRVLPVIEALARDTDTTISVDTTKTSVAKASLDAGAHIINDISGLTGDRNMTALAKAYGAGLVIMHMQGRPGTMQENPTYTDVVAEVSAFLKQQVERAIEEGLESSTLAVDPGIGFGKTLEHNMALLQNLPTIRYETGRPVLAGVSRKRFIGAITDRAVDDRLAGSLAAMSFAIMRGAGIIRVHDVKESCDVARMMAKLILNKDE